LSKIVSEQQTLDEILDFYFDEENRKDAKEAFGKWLQQEYDVIPNNDLVTNRIAQIVMEKLLEKLNK